MDEDEGLLAAGRRELQEEPATHRGSVRSPSNWCPLFYPFFWKGGGSPKIHKKDKSGYLTPFFGEGGFL